MEISKSDWKLFRAKIAGWQENYMDRLNQEYIALLSGDANPSDKFWALEDRIRKDRKSPGVVIDMRRSEMIYDLAGLIYDKVIGFEDLDGFSDELKEAVKLVLGR